MESRSDLLDEAVHMVLKKEPVSPLSMNDQKEEFEEVHEDEVNVKVEEYVKKEELDPLEPVVSLYSSEGEEHERSGPVVKEDLENKSLVGTHFEAPERLSEEMESASDVLEAVQMVLVKEEPVSPESLTATSEEFERTHEDGVNMKIEENIKKEESDPLEELTHAYSSEAVEHDFKEEIRQQHHAQCSAASSSLQIASFSIQPLSIEGIRTNSEAHFSRDSSSQCINLFDEKSKYQFPDESCCTADVRIVQEDTTNILLTQSQLETVRRRQHSNESVVNVCTLFEGTGPFRETQMLALLNNSTVGSNRESRRKDFICSACKMIFSEKSELSRHMLVHTNEIPFQCGDCGKSFIKRDTFNRHRRSHLSERPFKCSQCGKSFRESGSLRVHMRSHTGERPYKCSVCEKSFTKASTRSSHMLTHSEERPYKCSQCGKGFKKNSCLTIHMITHLRTVF